jgi:hypothetical protein
LVSTPTHLSFNFNSGTEFKIFVSDAHRADLRSLRNTLHRRTTIGWRLQSKQWLQKYIKPIADTARLISNGFINTRARSVHEQTKAFRQSLYGQGLGKPCITLYT